MRYFTGGVVGFFGITMYFYGPIREISMFFARGDIGVFVGWDGVTGLVFGQLLDYAFYHVFCVINEGAIGLWFARNVWGNFNGIG